MAEAMDFKFGTQLGFAKAHHKTTPRGEQQTKQTNKWFIGFWQPYGWITQAYIQKLHKI